MHTHSLIVVAGLFEQLQIWRVKLGKDFNLLIFVGAFLLVTFVVFIWAVSIRKPTRHHSFKPPRSSPTHLERKGGLFSRHRRPRKKHRRLNPTLAETGGLPDARGPNVPPKSPL